MLEQVANPLPCVATFTASGAPATGLTVTVNVRRWNGSSWVSLVSGASATEVGDGAYSYQLASGSVTVEGLYLFSFSTAGVADVRVQSVGWAVQKAGIEDLDAAISSRAAAGIAVVIASPVPSDGSVLRVVQGDDYAFLDGAQIPFTITGAGVPSLVGATVKLTLQRLNVPGSDLVVTGTVVDASHIYFELTAAQTAALNPASSYEFSIVATYPSTRTRTLVLGGAQIFRKLPAVP